ncbi:MAG TPA: glycoside hydrolase family 43 protein, partial [Chitinophagaceae bacterium]|nr:glycoside hydrolase family 43 protein [Chitinophagaceae bacterium]
MPEESIEHIDWKQLNKAAISQPLVTHMYTADPSAHIFEGKIYIYPSHDIDAGIPFDDLGSHFAMEDYHVLCMDGPGATAKDLGVVLHLKDVPWAAKQLWAPDAAYKNGKYYLYFPAKKTDGIFQIGVATASSPAGPFTAQPKPIEGSYSIDPAVFIDTDGSAYMYFGGLWGGQLQSYRNNSYDVNNAEPVGEAPALGPRVAKLTDDMLAMAEPVREIVLLDEEGWPLRAADNARRFFEASWMHLHKGVYYFSYSTGDTHFICYATGDNPYGPFTYRGKILE